MASDTTPNNFPADYDPNQVDSRVKLRSKSIENKVYGKDTREAMRQGIEIGAAIAQESNSIAKDTQNRFNNQIAGSQNDNEVVDARVKADGTTSGVLKQRLDLYDYKQTNNLKLASSDDFLGISYETTANGNSYFDVYTMDSQNIGQAILQDNFNTIFDGLNNTLGYDIDLHYINGKFYMLFDQTSSCYLAVSEDLKNWAVTKITGFPDNFFDLWAPEIVKNDNSINLIISANTSNSPAVTDINGSVIENKMSLYIADFNLDTAIVSNIKEVSFSDSAQSEKSLIDPTTLATSSGIVLFAKNEYDKTINQFFATNLNSTFKFVQSIEFSGQSEAPQIIESNGKYYLFSDFNGSGFSDTNQTLTGYKISTDLNTWSDTTFFLKNDANRTTRHFSWLKIDSTFLDLINKYVITVHNGNANPNPITRDINMLSIFSRFNNTGKSTVFNPIPDIVYVVDSQLELVFSDVDRANFKDGESFYIRFTNNSDRTELIFNKINNLGENFSVANDGQTRTIEFKCNPDGFSPVSSLYSGEISSEEDLNNFVNEGTYSIIGSNPQNSPINAADWAKLLVFSHRNDFSIQIYISSIGTDVTGTRIFKRSLTGNPKTWSPWGELSQYRILNKNYGIQATATGLQATKDGGATWVDINSKLFS